MSGYISDTSPLLFPGGKNESSIEGPGLIRSITGTNPAAGVEISETVPTGARWRIICFKATFVADATATTRGPRLSFDDGSLAYFTAGTFTSITASTTFIHSWAAVGQEDNSAASATVQCIPSDLILAAGHRITSSTVSIQAGDNWDAPQLLVEEWIQP